jgi:DNA-binding GntR family transcriptional regulator
MSAERTDPSATWSPTTVVDNTTLAYQQVREAILNGSLEPGSWISQVQLSRQLEVSRTPLREALRVLQTEGLVTADFNRRVRVAPLTIRDLETLYVMRIALEPLAVRLTVPDLDDEAVRALAKAKTQAHLAAPSSDTAAWTESHRRFHLGLIAGVDERMRQVVEDLWDHAERYRLLYRQKAASRLDVVEAEHEAILAAATRRDGIACSRLVAEHLSRTALTVIAHVDVGRDPKALREALRYVIGAPPNV